MKNLIFALLILPLTASITTHADDSDTAAPTGPQSAAQITIDNSPPPDVRGAAPEEPNDHATHAKICPTCGSPEGGVPEQTPDEAAKDASHLLPDGTPVKRTGPPDESIE